jgi:plastocyanin
MKGTRFLLAALAIVTLALAPAVLAGCGGDDDEGAATDTETVTETDTDTETGTPEAGGTLRGNVGPGFEISLTTEDGGEITALAPGSYTIEVEDQADVHNFHLTGPGVDESTSVEETGSSTFEVDLQPGTYTYVCDPHASTMTGSFEVSG